MPYLVRLSWPLGCWTLGHTVVAHGASGRDPTVASIEGNGEGIQDLISALVSVVDAQANQIAVISFSIAVIGALAVLGGAGLFVYIARNVRKAVDERVLSVIDGNIERVSAKAYQRNSIFLRALYETTRELAYDRKRKTLGRIKESGYSLSSQQDADDLISDLSEVILTPIHLFSTFHAIASSDSDPLRQKEDVHILFSEVADKSIRPRSMLAVVEALIAILSSEGRKSGAIEPLRAFADQLRVSIRSGELPKEPNF